MDGLVVCAMAGARRGRGFESRFVRPSRGPSVRPPPPPPSASRSTTGTAGATGGVSPPFFPTPTPAPGPRRPEKRSTRHSTPAAARSVTATAVRRVAHVLLIVLFRLPAEEDSNSGLQGGGRLHGRSTTLRETQANTGLTTSPAPPVLNVSCRLYNWGFTKTRHRAQHTCSSAPRHCYRRPPGGAFPPRIPPPLACGRGLELGSSGCQPAARPLHHAAQTSGPLPHLLPSLNVLLCVCGGVVAPSTR